MMGKVLGVPVTMPESPIDSVAKGLAIINSKIPVKAKGGKNLTPNIADYYKDKK
jgi:hypothetical protein